MIINSCAKNLIFNLVIHVRDEILDLMNAKKIAIMGGTFNPIHYGHLVAAEEARHKYNIEIVIFVPTGNPPHKEAQSIVHSEHRYLMSVLATYPNPFFEVSRLEIDRIGMSYTIDTVKEIRSRCSSDAKIYFITGADAIHQILEWKDADELLGMCGFIAVTRPGYDSTKLYEKISEIKSKNEGKVHFLEIPELAISSSDIRNRIFLGKPIKYLLPDPVVEYIRKYKLYEQTPGSVEPWGRKRRSIERRLRKALTDKRYIHTQGVAEESLKLADQYHADKDKTIAAALLHDCAKCCTPEENAKICLDYGIDLGETINKWPNVAHAFLGAEIAKKSYNINDEEILDAIRYHTTGRPNMSLIEKIVYIADCIEPNRTVYPVLDDIRLLAYKNLDDALITALRSSIDLNQSKGGLIHPLSVAALEYLENFKKNESGDNY